MSDFKCQILKIEVLPHPDPEVVSLEVGRIADYNVVVRKGMYVTGQRVTYIPEQAILPQSMLDEMNLGGKLAGSNKNRVKPVKLRGVMSQGLVYKDVAPDMPVGSDVTALLGITKYIPPVPSSWSGEMQSHPNINIKFDIENIKRHPDIFKENEEVVFTEKIHGTFMAVGLMSEDNKHTDLINGELFVSSKGLGADGLFFKDSEKNKSNVYIRAVEQHKLYEKLKDLRNFFNIKGNIWVLGEVYGIQKGYYYGTNAEKPGFRVFAIKINNTYLQNRELFENYSDFMKLNTTPVLYCGPFSKDVLKQYTDGKETITGTNSHIREGVVVTPGVERYHPDIGRAILKSVSDDYLGKSTGEEFN